MSHCSSAGRGGERRLVPWLGSVCVLEPSIDCITINITVVSGVTDTAIGARVLYGGGISCVCVCKALTTQFDVIKRGVRVVKLV